MDDQQRRFLSEALKKHGEDIENDPQRAKQVLISAGIVTQDGNLAPQYQYPRPVTEGDMNDESKHSARATARRIASGDLDAERLMRETLDCVAASNGALNAIVSLRPEEDLLREARAAMETKSPGPLIGLPVAVKDLANAKGLPTSFGSPAFAGQIAEADDPHVARLRAAGAIVIGKTNTPEFGLGSHTFNPVHGATRNPYDASRTCGGSSGGAAVALAAGMLRIADGSDMMGSLRNPAGWNNVYGMRPTVGRVPSSGMGDLFLSQLSTCGPMARCPDDLALLLDVMSGPDSLQPLTRPFDPCGSLAPEAAGARIAWLGDWGGAWPFEDGILALCEEALQVFSGLGAEVEAASPPFDRDALWESWTTLRSWALAADIGPLLDDPATAGQVKADAVWEVERGRGFAASRVQAASAARSQWYRAAAGLFDRFDALALPTAQVWPFAVEIDWPAEIAGVAMDTYHRWMEVMIPASLAGLPAVAVPAGFGAAGLPMGLQLVGRRGSDARLLQLAEAYHAATDWPSARPPAAA